MKPRITWTTRETEAVFKAAGQFYAVEENFGAAMRAAQEKCLPLERRRKVLSLQEISKEAKVVFQDSLKEARSTYAPPRPQVSREQTAIAMAFEKAAQVAAPAVVQTSPPHENAAVSAAASEAPPPPLASEEVPSSIAGAARR